MTSELSKLVDKVLQLSEKIKNGKDGVDFCVPSKNEPGFESTPLETEIYELMGKVIKNLEKNPKDVDSKIVEKLMICMENSSRARKQDRGDVGFGYTDFDSTLYSIIWDLRYKLKDALDKLKNKTDILSKVDKRLLEANNGEYLALYGVSREQSNEFKFKFTVDKLLNLSNEAKKSGKKGMEGLKEEIRGCLHEVYMTMDIDIIEDKSYHYSDSGYSPRTYNSDGTIQDGNIMKYFDEKLLNKLLESLINCKVLFVKGDYDPIKSKIKEVVYALKYLLLEMKKNKISPLEKADQKLFKSKENGFRKTFYGYFADEKPGEFC
ncbi:MAG: hypothetical protein ABII22_01095 [Candidatus Micrarchaeota archaeon]